MKLGSWSHLLKDFLSHKPENASQSQSFKEDADKERFLSLFVELHGTESGLLVGFPLPSS